MCGGGSFGVGKLFKGGLNLLDKATLGGVGLATAGLGLTGMDPFGKGLGAGDLLTGPAMPDMPDQNGVLPTQVDPAAAADQAQIDARNRERRRAAARFGRASTIGAGTVGAPAMAGKTAIGS